MIAAGISLQMSEEVSLYTKVLIHSVSVTALLKQIL